MARSQLGFYWPTKETGALFAWLISHQPTVLFSQNKPAISNQPEPASSILLSEQTSTSHQPPANRTGGLPFVRGKTMHLFSSTGEVRNQRKADQQAKPYPESFTCMPL
jgi:hypothetical protein